MKKILALGAATLAAGALACGAPDSGAPATTTDSNASCAAPPADVTSEAPSANPVSFANEIMPMFVTSCAFSECHGSARGDNHGVFLGAKSEANDASAIRAGIVGKPSTLSPSTPLVTPSDPSQSFLYRKLTGDLCGIPECEGDVCGRSMPRGGQKLDDASLATVRAWIAQGAPDS